MKRWYRLFVRGAAGLVDLGHAYSEQSDAVLEATRRAETAGDTIIVMADVALVEPPKRATVTLADP